jgi:hypothetical protein
MYAPNSRPAQRFSASATNVDFQREVSANEDRKFQYDQLVAEAFLQRDAMAPFGYMLKNGQLYETSNDPMNYPNYQNMMQLPFSSADGTPGADAPPEGGDPPVGGDLPVGDEQPVGDPNQNSTIQVFFQLDNGSYLQWSGPNELKMSNVPEEFTLTNFKSDPDNVFYIQTTAQGKKLAMDVQYQLPVTIKQSETDLTRIRMYTELGALLTNLKFSSSADATKPDGAMSAVSNVLQFTVIECQEQCQAIVSCRNDANNARIDYEKALRIKDQQCKEKKVKKCVIL